MAKTNKKELKNLTNRNGIWWVIFTYKGERYDTSTSQTQIIEAIKFKEEYIKSIKDGSYLQQLIEENTIEEIAFTELVEEFLLYKKTKIVSNTYKLYECLLKNINNYFNKKYIKDFSFEELKHLNIFEKDNYIIEEDFYKYINIRRKKQMKDGFILKELKLLKTIFNFAVKRKYISKNIFENCSLKEELNDYEINDRILTTEEIKKLLQNCNPYLKRLIVVLLGTGMRIKECIKATKNMLEKNYTYILLSKEITKSHKERIVPLCDISQLQIKEQLLEFPKQNYIITDAKGNNYKTTPKTALKNAFTRAKIQPAGFHIFRHTFASLRLQGIHPITGEKIKPLDIVIIAKILGHSEINITLKHYAKHCNNSILEAYNNFKL